MQKKLKHFVAFVAACCLAVAVALDAEAANVPTREASEKSAPEITEPVSNDSAFNYVTGEGVTMLGDSIMNGNRRIILSQLPKALIEAKGSRNVCGGFEAATKLQEVGKLSDVVIVELGTNGPLVNHEPYASGAQNLLKLLGPNRQIFWVTVYCSYSQWMNMNNEFIRNLPNTHPNVTVIDWYSLAIQHPEWFRDGVHPTMEGARNFAKLLKDSLAAKYGNSYISNMP